MPGWHEISESEKKGYLLSRAREMALYGSDTELDTELMAKALCAVWGWDPKKYGLDSDIDGDR